MKKTASHNQDGESHQEGLLPLTLEGLIPPNQILVLNLALRTATLLYNAPEGKQTIVEQQHFSPNGMRVLVPLLEAYPKYRLHEVLFASLVCEGEAFLDCLYALGRHDHYLRSDHPHVCNAHVTQAPGHILPPWRKRAMPEVASLQQVERDQLKGHLVQYSDAQHLVLIDGAVVPCTPGEYDLLLPLLKHAGEPISFPRLLGSQGRKTLTQGMRRGLTQQMSRLRARLWPYELDILCLNTYGYLLLSRSHEHIEEI